MPRRRRLYAKTAEVICQQLQGEHGDNQSIEQLPDPSARLTLSVENLTFIKLLKEMFFVIGLTS